MFALRQCVNYFISRCSSVFMAAFDAKKAFDRVHHVKLLYRLCDIGAPLQVVRLIANWYSKNYYEGEMGELLLLFVHHQDWREATRCAVTGPF